MTAIASMLYEARALIESIKDGNSDQVEAKYRRFREAVQAAWDSFQRGEVTVSVRGLPRAMYIWAIEELPRQLEDASRWDEARRELAQFIRTVELVVEPKEV